MIHKMHLFKEPFELIANGRKTIEIRLFDSKRRKIKLGDMIEFEEIETEQNISCKVVGISIFPSFRDLLTAFDNSKFGHPESITLKGQLARQYSIYKKSEEEANGVMGIHIQSQRPRQI